MLWCGGDQRKMVFHLLSSYIILESKEICQESRGKSHITSHSKNCTFSSHPCISNCFPANFVAVVMMPV